MNKLQGVVLLLAFSIVPLAAEAQSCSANGLNKSCVLTINTPNTTTLTIGGRTISVTASTTALAFAPTATDLTAGATASQPITFAVAGNTNWVLSVSGASTTWTTPAGAPKPKPIGDLLWALTSGGAGTSITTSNAQFASGTPGAVTDPGHSVTVYFRTAVAWVPNGVTGAGMAYPGSYSASLTFTLTAQ